MDYRLGVAGGPEAIDGGTGILFLHPSTAGTDRIDTDFLKAGTDHFLVVSTRTTAHEVDQKLEFYDVDPDKATIVDAISAERGYSRRQSDRVTYLRTPDDVDKLLDSVRTFLEGTEGRRRISFDSITELSFYAGETRTQRAVEQLLELLEANDAVGLFHLSTGIHDDEVVEHYRSLFDVVVELDPDGDVDIEA
ncbi:MAG: hypothetical protein ACLFMX_00120 [Halobacteriales archaeon]